MQFFHIVIADSVHVPTGVNGVAHVQASIQLFAHAYGDLICDITDSSRTDWPFKGALLMSQWALLSTLVNTTTSRLLHVVLTLSSRTDFHV